MDLSYEESYVCLYVRLMEGSSCVAGIPSCSYVLSILLSTGNKHILTMHQHLHNHHINKLKAKTRVYK